MNSPSRNLMFVFLAIALVLGVLYGKYMWKEHQDEKKAEQVATEQRAAEYARTHPPAQAVPLAEDTTPCKLYVGWGTVMKTGGRPVLIKYHGKTKWIRLSGRENDKITLDQFTPGDAEFISTDSTPVQVKICPPER